MMKSLILVGLILTSIPMGWANENCTAANRRAVCTDDSVKEKVEWACKLVETKGKGSLADIKKMRYDCCGEPNYVWINDMKPKMVMHPIKPLLDGTDLTNSKDPNGFALFVAFTKAVQKTPAGDWVDYLWTKFGESKPTPKKSYVKRCKAADAGEDWVVGSGSWK